MTKQTQNQFKEVIEMYTDDYDAEEISEVSGLPLETINAWIEQHETSLGLAGVYSEVDPEDEFEEEQEEGSSSLNGLGEATVALLTKDAENRANEAEVKNKKLRRAALNAFHKLLEGLQEHTSGSVWKKDEIKKVLSECDLVIDLVEEACSFNADKCKSLGIYEITIIVKRLFKNYLYDHHEGFVISWSSVKHDMIDAGLQIESFEDDSTFDRKDHYRQEAWQIVVEFLDEVLNTKGTLSVAEVDNLLSGLKSTRKEITDDLPEELEGEFDEELEVLEEIESFLREYRIRTEEALFGKRYSIPDQLVARIKELQSQGEEVED